MGNPNELGGLLELLAFREPSLSCLGAVRDPSGRAARVFCSLKFHRRSPRGNPFSCRCRSVLPARKKMNAGGKNSASTSRDGAREHSGFESFGFNRFFSVLSTCFPHADTACLTPAIQNGPCSLKLIESSRLLRRPPFFRRRSEAKSRLLRRFFGNRNCLVLRPGETRRHCDHQTTVQEVRD